MWYRLWVQELEKTVLGDEGLTEKDASKIANQ
jgi:hypothetical protein